MKTRRISIWLVLVLLLTMVPAVTPAAQAVDEAEYGWPEMQGDIAVRMTQTNVEMTRLVVGEVYVLQFWLQNVGPHSLVLPLCWDPAVVEVVDPKTGDPVESGRKADGEVSGFRAGSGCYDTGFDEMTYDPLYWNGRPVYTSGEVESTEGYPYLNREGGHYRFCYYVDSPNAPAQAQMFLEVSFRAIGSGDPNFHIATSADGEGRYDPAEPNGLELLMPGGEGESSVVNYTDSVVFPVLTVKTEEEYRAEEEAAREPEPSESAEPDNRPSAPGGSGNGSGTSTAPGGSGTTAPPVPSASSPEVVAELMKRQEAVYFPYTTALSTTAVLRNVDGEITSDSDYIIPVSEISDRINNDLSGTERSILVKMPDEMLEKDEYALNFSMSNIDDMARNGLPMLYVESPWGYVGLNTAILVSNLPDSAKVRVLITPNGNGLRVEMTADGEEITGFAGPVLRIILPYEKPATNTLTLPVSPDVMDDENGELLPLSINRLDVENNTLIFLSPSFGSFHVVEQEEPVFSDLPDDEQSLAVLSLGQSLVFDGVGEDIFQPKGLLSWARGAKALVCAFGMYRAEPMENGYSDVSEDNRYYSFIQAATANELTDGLGEGSFGIGYYMTREDLAEAVYHGLTQLGVTLPETETIKDFQDDNEISADAKEAVYALSKAGIISADEDGNFRPQEEITRVEAAEIIHYMMQHLQSVL